MENKRDLLRSIPSVEKVLGNPGLVGLGDRVPRWNIMESTREVLAEIRQSITEGHLREEPRMSEIVEEIVVRAQAGSRRSFTRVINGTGVVMHTNLGRATLSDEAVNAVAEVAGSYSNLEFDLAAGKRTTRNMHVEKLLLKITGCESACVVNNNAGAVLLALNTLAEGKETIVSRGELIEIGGSFRLPEVMDKSGTTMVEVGTTNRTRLEDYERAITKSEGVILKVHQSNFDMTGFVESVAIKSLAELAHRNGMIMVEDLGSGALTDLSQFGVEKEPMPQESLKSGVDVVTFSGDKLLCGPQAGIIVGKAEFVDRMKANPLARALRVDKMTLVALEVTLRHYLEPGQLLENLPTLRMMSCKPGDIRQRADRVAASLSAGLKDRVSVSVKEVTSQIGGGSLPSAGLASYAVALSSGDFSADRIASMLRGCAVPIVARILEDNVIIDFRTVQPSEDETLTSQILKALAGGDRR
ncbi:MAG: L-seryl-tRNA(Sec) selenium transferase [Candidatus Eisenbacteria bacterium]